MSDLPHKNTDLSGIIKWAREQLGRPPTEGEIAVVRVAMEMKRRRQTDRLDRRRQAAEVAEIRRRRQGRLDEDEFQERMKKEIEDEYIFAICLIFIGRTTTGFRTPAKPSKALLSKTDPRPIIRSGLSLKAQESTIYFEPAPEQRHRALLAYIASKMPELATDLPPNPPEFGVDNPTSFYDISAHKWEIRADLHPHHLALINAQRPDRVAAIFREVVATYPHESGPLMDKIGREGEIASRKALDWPQAFAFTPGEPPLALLPEPPKADIDDLLAESEGLDLDGDGGFTPEGL